ncbi:MAG TPA: hypothetical protein VNH44_07680 [Micropepsaceae bacterium]|nr:hypothetical protein [Micropepsaceae bacterium]
MIGVAFLSGSAFAQTPGALVATEASSLIFPFATPQLPISQLESFGAVRTYGSAYDYYFGNGFKAQIQSLTFASVSDRLGGLAAGGNFASTRMLLKGMYEFSDGGWHVMPFIGVGLGVANLNGQVLGVNADDWATTYQLSGGVALGFTEKLMGNFEYRWTDGSKATFSLAGIPTNVDMGHHDFVLGINYKY